MIDLSRIEEIRARDASHPQDLPEHWTGPADRRYLLSVIDELLEDET